MLWLEIPRFNTDFLYTTGLASGLGSNDIGLDRGQSGDAAVVYFERIGPRVLLIRRNDTFRSSSSNPAERKSVEDSFAKSVISAFPVEAQTGGRVLINATRFSSGTGTARPTHCGLAGIRWTGNAAPCTCLARRRSLKIQKWRSF